MLDDLGKELLDRVAYNPETGELTWRVADVRWFQDNGHSAEMNCRKWNGRYAGTPAFARKHNNRLVGGVRGKKLMAHRVAWLVHHGDWPDGEIDHINGNGHDNRACNLRVVDRKGNTRNVRRLRRNTSGQTGVSERGGRWFAYINDNGRQISLGLFLAYEDAVRARKSAERRLGYHPNHGRAA